MGTLKKYIKTNKCFNLVIQFFIVVFHHPQHFCFNFIHILLHSFLSSPSSPSSFSFLLFQLFPLFFYGFSLSLLTPFSFTFVFSLAAFFLLFLSSSFFRSISLVYFFNFIIIYYIKWKKLLLLSKQQWTQTFRL